MTKDLHTTTQNMIAEIDRKDRRFRTAQTIFMILLFLVMAVIVVAEYHVIQNQNRAANGHSQEVTAIERSNTATIKTLSQHIDCIVSLFGKPNRAQLTITNIQNCQLSTAPSSPVGTTGTTKSYPAPPTPARSAPTPSTTNKPQSNSQKAPSPSKPLICKLTLGLLGC